MSPKRKRNEETDENYNYIYKKLKKLEKKLKRSKKKPRRHSTSSSISMKSDASSPVTEGGGYYENDDLNIDEEETVTTLHAVESPPKNLQQDQNEAVELDPVPGPSGIQLVEPVGEDIPTPQMESLLELLGEDPSINKKKGKEVNADLAIRLQYIATEGLSKDVRKDLQEKYLQPSNCPLTNAPTLNPEIKAAVSDAILKRDAGFEAKQRQLSSAITCIAEATTILLQEENKNKTIIKLLMDASRILCDCQYADSIRRRNFVLFSLKKDMRDQVSKTKIDELLFGKELCETLRTAKLISKSGADLKLTPTSKGSIEKPKPTHIPLRNLNWKAPPPSRRPKGTQRMKEPAQRGQHASFSRPSYRAPPPPPQPGPSRSRR